jgi:hypothetical protein
MKRSSVRYNVTPSYSRNIESEKASANVRRNSTIVLLVGLILVGLVVLFILKNVSGAALLAGALVPGNPFDEGQQDDDLWKVVLGIVGVIILLVGLPLSFILA